MKTVLIKVRIAFDTNIIASKKIQGLRKWCYTNIKSPWSTYHIFGINNTVMDDSRTGFVAFRFDSKNEAMKFQLYVGK